MEARDHLSGAVTWSVEKSSLVISGRAPTEKPHLNNEEREHRWGWRVWKARTVCCPSSPASTPGDSSPDPATAVTFSLHTPPSGTYSPPSYKAASWMYHSVIKKESHAGHWWPLPVILATWKLRSGGSRFKGSPPARPHLHQ
jgi:hypothetical protein